MDLILKSIEFDCYEQDIYLDFYKFKALRIERACWIRLDLSTKEWSMNYG